MQLPNKVTGKWTLAELAAGKIGAPKHGLKVFSAFHCGGGSTMGYKLAGYDVLGGVEIDPEMMAIYRANHKPKHSFLMGVQQFNALPDSEIPDELRNLDILDGSPPCSSVSMSGSREDAWGEKKVFREGQALQVLDDLFFHFIAMADRLRPKVVVAENVKGLVLGNAKGYVKEIFAAFARAGYDTQLFLLNASRMGVPQARERVFFVARRNDIGIKPFALSFEEPRITVRQAFEGINPYGSLATPLQTKWWGRIPPGTAFSKGHPKGHWFNCYRLHPDKPAPTLPANMNGNAGCYMWDRPTRISGPGLLRIQSFPDDFVAKDPGYVCGMSVPPLMMQRVALAIAPALLPRSSG